MKFLCSRHRRMVANLSLTEQNDLWMFWMEYAATFSETHETEKMIAATGNAFNLAYLARDSHPDCMHVELTLSAILMCRILRARDDHTNADYVLFSTLESLRSANLSSSSASDCCSIDQCIEMLLDTSQQARFFAEYLSWPETPWAPQEKQRVMVAH